MSLRRTFLAVGAGVALAYFFDPVSGAERRARVQKAVEDQLNKRTGLDGDTETTTVEPEPAS